MSKSLEELKNEYVESCDNESGSFLQRDLENIRRKAWDAAIKAVSDREKKLVESCEKSLFALQCMIIKFNGEVPGLTGQQVFDGAVSARDNLKEALKDYRVIKNG